MERRRRQVAVVGAAGCGPEIEALATLTGAAVARAGCVLLTGGRGGVMAAASSGARSEGGLTVGILPGVDAASSPPAPAVDVALYTGLGQARNVVLVLSAEAVIAVGGSWGTLSEIAIARKHGRPVVLLESWSVTPPATSGLPEDGGLLFATTPQQAVDMAMTAAGRRADGDGARGGDG